MKNRHNVITRYPHLFQNPDSLISIGEVRYAAANKLDDYHLILARYVNEFMSREDHRSRLVIAQNLTENYFQREVLSYAIQLADESNALVPTWQGYYTKSIAFDKLNQFKAAYANLLLAYQYASDGEVKLLDEYEKELRVKMEYELVNGVTSIGTGDDGRFTLGAGINRLMYGYPVPQSTSHFIVNVDGKLASNRPNLQNATYLTSKLQLSGESGTPAVAITFRFEGVTIVQKLIPVDRDGAELTSGLAQYYKIVYELTSNSNRTRKVGIGLLIDTMIDDNDACVIAADQQLLDHEYGFQKNIPATLLLYRTANDSSDMMGEAIIRGMEATKPDKLVVGRWPVLYHVSWELSPQKVRYGDSAYFIKWENRALTKSNPLQFVTYYGLPRHKKPQLSIILKDADDVLTMDKMVYFEHESDQLDLNAKMMIANIIYRPNIQIIGVLLNGYTDLKGNYDYNYALSERRIAAVGELFSKSGIPYVPKPYSFEKAIDTPYTRQFGNVLDRRVQMLVYYRIRQESTTDRAAATSNE